MKTARKRPGRPQIPRRERKEAAVSVSMTAAERLLIERAAKRAGVKRTAWCRERLVEAARDSGG